MDKKKKILLFITIALSAIILGVVAAIIFNSLGKGSTFRNGSCASVPDRVGKGRETPTATADPNLIVITTEQPTPNVTAEPEETEAPTPEPTEVPIDPYEELMEKADTSMMKDIVNVLLIGVDYSTERETWDGKKEWHSDVMMVLAVNFEENRADLISLPRDTYANIPDVKGIYKLNASLNCGGGLYNDDGTVNPRGLEKVCEAAEWMLGGIDVDYYYAVTMTSLKDLVDLCGGLEYDLEFSYHIQGRSYEKGLQHIDGQGFLDYCRVRKGQNGIPGNEQGDANRVNRQKRMLIAMFKQMKADQLITKMPEIIDTFDGDLFTNCTFGQTAALAAFAYKLDPENIGMYSMSGASHSLFQWNFCFTDQANRVDIIKKVYGVSAKRYSQYTLSYARYRWCDMLYDKYMGLLDPLTKYVQKLIDEDDKLPEFTSSPTPSETPSETPSASPTKTPAATDTPKPEVTDTPKPTEPPTPTPAPTKTPAPTEAPGDGDDSDSVGQFAARGMGSLFKKEEQTRKYTQEQRELFERYKTCVKELNSLHKEADKEAKKARNGSSNSLNSVGQSYLNKLAEAQTLAIEVAQTFEYNKVKNFTSPFGPTATGWSSSPWAVNYGKNKKFNEVIVDFN